MNKVSLLTIGRKLQDNNLYLLSIHDLEPSGLIVHAYDQTNSKELMLPVSEHEVRKDSTFILLFLTYPPLMTQLLSAGISRTPVSLSMLLDSISLVPQGAGLVLQSSLDAVSNIQHRVTGSALEQLIKTRRLGGSSQTINDLLVTGLVELCKVKPVGVGAVEWLGDWLLANNPCKPLVLAPDEDDE